MQKHLAIKKKKSTKHLDFYKKCMETGHLPWGGLCNCATEKLIDIQLLSKIFTPDDSELERMYKKGYIRRYWGYGFKIKWSKSFEKSAKQHHNLIRRLTPLRQNIVLFMAAIKREL